MERRFFITAMIVLTAAFVVSCTDDMEVNNNGGQEERNAIQFTVDDSQDWYLTSRNETTTRAIANGDFASRAIEMQTSDGHPMTMTSCVVNGIDGNGLAGKAVTRGATQDELPSSFKMAAYTYTSAPTWTSYFSNQLATNSSGTWSLSQTQYWPNNHDLLRFYAYAPSNGSSTLTMSSPTLTTAPYLDFTVNPVVLDQEDLMTAVTEATHFSTGLRVSLPFKHALTCVRFCLGDAIPATGRILSISLENIVSKGRYNFEGVWTPTTDSLEFAMNNINFDFTSTMKGDQIVYSANEGGLNGTTMLMIPQTFNSDKQRVKVIYNDGTNNITAYASLKNTSWLPGTTVTYYLSTSGTYQYVLDVIPVTSSHNGGEHTFYVRSYRQPNNGNPQQLHWEVTGYSTDGVNFTDTKPESCNWFGLGTTGGNGGTELEPGKVWVTEQTGVTPENSPTDANAMKAYMGDRTPRGEMINPFDLSRHDVIGNPSLQNTANCYVVNAPGWYKLPLIYGNGIKNGTENEEAWTPGNSNNKFKDYLDGNIENPYIYQTATPGGATLVWQDADGLIDQSTVQLCDNGTYLKFQIPAGTTFQQGNAIVAVLDNASPNKRIMWSWHIWVTDVDILATIPVMNYQKQTYDFMPCNLGWCSIGTGLTHYPGRTAYIRIRQEGGKEAVLFIGQLEGDALVSERGYNPFFQSMRKDPLGPGTGTGNADRTTYGPYKSNYNAGIRSKQSIGYSIQNPNIFIDVQQNTWINETRYDLWNAGATANATVYTTIKKTIYDPSPVGFHMPEASVFTGFTSNGARSESNSFTAQYKSVSYGTYYYTDDIFVKTIHIPATGVHETWNNSGVSLSNWNTHTSIWTGGAYNGSTVYLWSGGASYAYPFEQYNCGSRGMCVRPVADY